MGRLAVAGAELPSFPVNPSPTLVQVVIAVCAVGSAAALAALGDISGSDFIAILVGVLTGHFALQQPKAPAP